MATGTIGYWAGQRERFLEAKYPAAYKTMKARGQLAERCRAVAEQAADAEQELLIELENRSSVQGLEYAEKVRTLEAIPLQAREIVQKDVIEQPL